MREKIQSMGEEDSLLHSGVRRRSYRDGLESRGKNRRERGWVDVVLSKVRVKAIGRKCGGLDGNMSNEENGLMLGILERINYHTPPNE